jgi:D-cysteine desulfhydrase
MHTAEPPRISLAQLPTPVIESPRLAKRAGVKRLLIKHDDLTGFEVSGNKIRKLEYVIADALAKKADTLVTHGGFQSNHCRATAAAAARLGLRARIFLREPADTRPPANDGNLFLDHLFGADISMHSLAEYNDRAALIESVMAAEHAADRTPYFFPVGASVPIGCWGYVRCMHELRSQFAPSDKLDLFVPLSSGGTYAGCVLGKALFELDAWRIIGVPVSDSVDYFRKDARGLIDDTIATFGLDLGEADTPVELLGGYIGEGYAIPYPESVEMIRIAAREEGLIVDPTYTSKALFGTLDSLAKGFGRPDATPMFLQTGGAFGLMARRDLFS